MFDVHATEEEDKLVLLSAIDRLGGCTEEQLMRFAVETGLMSQFPFSIALSSLKEDAFVRTSHRLEGELLHLTPEGRQSVELFAGQIRPSQEEKLAANVRAWRRRIRDEQQMPADWQETDSGFVVTLRALEGGAEIFNLKVTAATKVQAKRFCERWPQKAPELYQTIMQALGETAAQEDIKE